MAEQIRVSDELFAKLTGLELGKEEVAAAPRPDVYTVQQGDSYYKIAEKLYGDRAKAKELYRTNDKQPLRQGMRISYINTTPRTDKAAADPADAIAKEFIKRREGFVATPYWDHKGYSVGYGKLFPSKEAAPRQVTKEQADKWFEEDYPKYKQAVERHVKVPLSANQKAALTSFVYNLGEENFRKSTLLKRLNRKDYRGVADELLKWNKAKDRQGILREEPGLTKRRQAERQLWLSR